MGIKFTFCSDGMKTTEAMKIAIVFFYNIPHNKVDDFFTAT